MRTNYLLLFPLLFLFTASLSAQDCPTKTRPGIHVVKRGETLWGISKRYGMSVDEIVAANGIDLSKPLRSCNELRVRKSGEGRLDPTPADPPSSREVVETQPRTSGPAPGATFVERLANSGGVHNVRQGETLVSIANYYGYTVARLREMNGLLPENIIQPGQNLIVSSCFFQNGGSIGIRQ